LTSITIPSSVTRIGGEVFAFCSSLKSVAFKGNNPPKISDFYGIFWRTPNNLRLIIPKGTENAYIEAGYPEDRLIEQ